MALVQHPSGNYRFVPFSNDPRVLGNAPFSNGVSASPGYEIVHATFQRPLPYHEGFAAAERHLASIGRPRAALCAVELRCPEPHTRESFGAFNAEYREQLMAWDLFVDGQNPVARSNIAPGVNPPTETLLYAFSYTVPARDSAGKTFVISGAPEKPEVRPGDTAPDALREKTASVMQAMDAGLGAVGAGWDDVTALNLYTQHDIHAFLDTALLAAMGPAAAHGIHWFWSRPPVVGLEIEADIRAIRDELRLM
jgi:enamine deaminase RidA (YjgF/YER057c/UK114 family)